MLRLLAMLAWRMSGVYSEPHGEWVSQVADEWLHVSSQVIGEDGNG